MAAMTDSEAGIMKTMILPIELINSPSRQRSGSMSICESLFTMLLCRSFPVDGISKRSRLHPQAVISDVCSLQLGLYRLLREDLLIAGNETVSFAKYHVLKPFYGLRGS